MQVRDYECDLQGIVNNSVYQNYLEHCRHKFLQHVGMDFAQLHNDGIDAVVIRVEIDYKQSLFPNDEFTVRLSVHKQGRLRFVFDQEIIRGCDKKLIVKAKVFTVLTKQGRPIAPDLVEDAIKKHGFEFEEK